jgi:exonuclease SbcC
MIPLRVKLRGFLSYRDEQALDFTEAPLWMLAGPNGSGKSAVFDAVTYALFGQHRGGGKDADELINKQSDGFAIEFEFALGDANYLIRRTLKRTPAGKTSATQQILRRDSRLEKWSPVSETNKKTAFNDWIQENIGLRFATFAASVLLVQGQAERLLSQTPADRFKVLADVVDLERYIRLHARVDDRRKALKSQLEVLRNQLIGLPVVTAADLTAAQEREKNAETVRKQAAEAVDALRAVELAAHRWAELQRRVAELKDRRSRNEQIITRSVEVERDAARLRELNAVIPLAEKLLTASSGVATAQRNLVELERQAATANEKFTALSGTVDQLNRQRESLQKYAELDDARRVQLADELKSLAVIVVQLDAWERHQRELAEHEAKLKSMPPDLAEQVTNAQRLVDELNALDRSLSTLQRLASARSEVLERIGQQAELERQLKSIQSKGEMINAELAQHQKSAEESAHVLSSAQVAAGSAKTLLQQAQTALEALTTLGAEPNCRLCGQALTPEHRADEEKRRTEDLEAAGRQSDAADKALVAAQTAYQAANAEVEKAKTARDAKRDEYRSAKQQFDQAVIDIQRLQQSLTDFYGELPASIAVQVSPRLPRDWGGTSYPTESDLDGIRKRIGALPAHKTSLADLQAQQRETDALRGAIDSARRMIASLTVPSNENPAAIRGRHTRCAAELAALDERIQKRRTELATLQTEYNRAGQQLENARRANEESQRHIGEERTKLQLAEQTVQSALESLPETWRSTVAGAGLADQSAWKDERDQLTDAGVEQKAAELEAVRASMSVLFEQESKLTGEIAAIPEDQRIAVADIEQRIRDGQAAIKSADKTLRETQTERIRVETQLKQREDLAGRVQSVDHQHNLHEQLAELLGRDRLQSHLVRRAERQIVEQANAVLDRLSGGELHLRLRGSVEEDSAFDMETVNRAAGAEPIGVSYLSGSQRFRVAVSLALGIGRFASGQHRPIESVIIDEGFGCLDRNGRQVMIQELQNLREFLKRILLVSHQEEFADAFRDGYRFELVNGATLVTRFQR